MTKQETGVILDIIKTAFPTWKAQPKALEVWSAFFADDSAEDVLAAVKAFIVSDRTGFAPSIGQIKGRIVDNGIISRSEAEVVQLVRNAVSNGKYEAVEEWEKLPEDVKCLVSPQQINDYANMSIEVFNSVIMSNLLRAYRAGIDRKKAELSLPGGSVKALPEINKLIAKAF